MARRLVQIVHREYEQAGRGGRRRGEERGGGEGGGRGEEGGGGGRGEGGGGEHCHSSCMVHNTCVYTCVYVRVCTSMYMMYINTVSLYLKHCPNK